MRHIWFDLSVGVSGDMLLGALVDAGAPLPELQAAIDSALPGAVRLQAGTVDRAGQRATKVLVELLVEDPPHRTWREIRRLLADSGLAEPTRASATAAFGLLAEAEARAHGVDPDDIHFHEVGALDSIADIVGVCEAVRLLGVDTVSASPVALGSGRVRVAHGDVGVPVPAVAELAIGWQTVDVSAPPAGVPAGRHDHAPTPGHSHSHPHGHSHDDGHTHDHPHDQAAPLTSSWGVGELATPTGLALIRALASDCGSLPPMELTAVGVGGGSRDTAGRPNVVRALVGVVSDHHAPANATIELMTNVDDLDPRFWPGVLDALLAEGALDAWLVPIQMKKGRPAFTLHALVDAARRAPVVDAILRHTSTLGVREVPCSRTTVDRTWRALDVLDRPLRVKVGSVAGTILHATAEYADLAAIAHDTGTPEYEVAQHAAAAIASAGLTAGSGLPG